MIHERVSTDGPSSASLTKRVSTDGPSLASLPDEGGSRCARYSASDEGGCRCIREGSRAASALGTAVAVAVTEDSAGLAAAGGKGGGMNGVARGGEGGGITKGSDGVSEALVGEGDRGRSSEALVGEGDRGRSSEALVGEGCPGMLHTRSVCGQAQGDARGNARGDARGDEPGERLSSERSGGGAAGDRRRSWEIVGIAASGEAAEPLVGAGEGTEPSMHASEASFTFTGREGMEPSDAHLSTGNGKSLGGGITPRRRSYPGGGSGIAGGSGRIRSSPNLAICSPSSCVNLRGDRGGDREL